MSLIQSVKKVSAEILPELIEIRRLLHANPELSFEEKETSRFIQRELEKTGIPFEVMADTGVVGLIKGEDPESDVLALRADIDALPIHEANNVSYKSKNEGVMHACGHDVHTTSLLGASKILWDHRSDFRGTIKLIFQPGEEKLPGGASLMIKEGVLENPAPSQIIGQHVMPLIPAGKVGFRSGMYMASADEIYMKVVGKGGHAAMPEHNIDPIAITAQIITALQQVVSRNAPPKIPSVLSFGKIIGEGATNVIPNEVRLEGTFRTFDEEWRSLAHENIERTAKGIAQAMGATCDIEIKKGYPFLKNNPRVTDASRSMAQEYLGSENVVDLDIWLAAEDFAWYSQEIDACFYRLGTRNEALGITSGVHTPTFDIDESALEIGAGLLAWMALQSLKL